MHLLESADIYPLCKYGVDEELFPSPQTGKPYRVQMPFVCMPKHHDLVRWWLQDAGWKEFEDYIVVPHSFQTNMYEVWFKDIGKAVLFKLSFTL